MKIGIIREGKIPADQRAPFTPEILKSVADSFADQLECCVEQSNLRAFSNQEYLDKGVEIVVDMSDVDVLFGVKEVPIEQLIPNKTYFFFSHTIKKQAKNKKIYVE